MGYVLGVDLGTTFTAAAIHRDGWFDPVALADGSPLVPSVVFAREDDTFAFGDAADRLAARDPSRVARAFKRRFGDETPLVLGGSPYSADGLTGRLLQWVVDRVRALEGGPPDRIALTHPASWRGFKLDLLRQAVQHTGLGTEFECLTVSEPHAAAMWYSSQSPLTDDQLVAVYDLGGGTFDAAVLRQTSSGFAMLGEPQGIERLGGLHLDEAVFRHVVDTLGLDLDSVDPEDGAVTNGLRRLRVDCTAAKEALSEDTDATIDVALPGGTPRCDSRGPSSSPWPDRSSPTPWSRSNGHFAAQASRRATSNGSCSSAEPRACRWSPRSWPLRSSGPWPSTPGRSSPWPSAPP